ncbi:MAG: cytochrome c [Kofleriaceae bacterium]
MCSRLLAALAVVVACGKGDVPPEPSSGVTSGQETGPKKRVVDPEADQEAQQLFVSACSTCHGMDGKGGGPVSVSLNPKPRNYTDPTWQATVTDTQIKQIILEGGAAVGKSPSMMAFPSLKDQPAVLDALVRIVRGFAKQPGSGAP